MIEYRYKDYKDGRPSHWIKYYNNRIYKSNQIAIEAIVQLKQNNCHIDKEFRVTPIYTLDQNYYREITISKLLK